MTFQFDTSGAVIYPSHPDEDSTVCWRSLSPFVQGYVEAMFASGRPLIPLKGDSQHPFRAPAFSDLAPESLARIMEDCERFLKGNLPCTQEDGRVFWQLRQEKEWPKGFPHLTPYLGGDGKVYLR